MDGHVVQLADHQIKQTKRVKRGNRQQNEAPQQLEVRFRYDIANQNSGGEKQENPFAKRDNSAAFEDRQHDAFSNRRKRIGQQRQQ